MTWTAQTGLGPRTVALSLKVFIVVMCCAHERLGICTAQRTLPDTLRNYVPEMREHFCSEGNMVCNGNPDNCENRLNRLCAQIFGNNRPNNCWTTSQDPIPLCNGNQTRLCDKRDAVVCQDNRGTCVYRSDPQSTFCICANQDLSYTGCEPTVSTEPPTTEEGDTSGTNVAAIVFGSLFALLLLFVIIAAVMLYLRSQGRLPSFMKRTANPAELSSVSLEARIVTRSKLSEPPVPGSNVEYSYAYDHRPAKTGAKEDSDQDDHTYYSVGEGGYREGNHCYVIEGQRKILATKELTSTDDAQDHAYLVLNRNDEDDEVGNKTGGGHADKVEMTDSTTGFKSKEANDEDYTPLVPTGNLKSRSEHPGKEVAASPTSANEGDVTSPIELPTEGLSNGDDGTYFPLIQTAAPKSTVKQSGYEDAKIPTSESHDTTSSTDAQTTSCDDDTYTPLVQTADSKSPKEHSG